MYELKEIKAESDYLLVCQFTDGTTKKVDIKPLLEKEAFKPLKDIRNFMRVINKSYFIEWLGLDIDLSADTLWHLGT